jgi:hypothetical protein
VSHPRSKTARRLKRIIVRTLHRAHALKTNYLLIDYENVQPMSLSVLNGHPFKLIVFLGANQAKVPVKFASALQTLGTNAEYIQISGNGSNALDFHIAFTVGELSKSDPNACFHIISKDSGFDPLIGYLRKKGIVAHRSKAIAHVPIFKVTNAKTVPEKLEAIVRNLVSRGTAKPRKVKTLSNTINALFRNLLDDVELASLVKALEKHGHISIEGESVKYHPSGEHPAEE